MAVLVYSIVRRHMKRAAPGAFTVFSENEDPPVKLSLAPEESLIGWYRNPPPWEHYLVVFTSEALYLVDGEQVERLAIKNIIGYARPRSKRDVTGVRVLTKDGFRFVRIAGHCGPEGNQRDAFSFISVIRGLVPGNPLVADEGALDDEA